MNSIKIATFNGENLFDRVNGLKALALLKLILLLCLLFLVSGCAEDPEVTMNLGILHFKAGRYDKALEKFDSVVRSGSADVEVYFYRGAAYHRQKLVDQALKDYNQAISIDPDHASAHFIYSSRASIFFYKRLFEQAIKDCDTAIRLNPESFPGYSQRGFARFFLNRYEAAARDFQAAIRLDSSSTFRMLWLCLARQHAGEDGIEELRTNSKASDLTKWPGPVIAMFLGNLTPAQVLAAAKNPDAKKQREQECEASFYIGQYYLQQGDRGQAGRFFQKTLDFGITDFYEHIAAEVELERMGLLEPQPNQPPDAGSQKKENL